MNRMKHSVLGMGIGIAGLGTIPMGLAAAIVIGAGSPISAAQPIEHRGVDLLVAQRSMPVPGVGLVTSIKSVHADVRINGTVAKTTITMVVHNPTQSRAQAQVVLPVPAGSAISTFGIDGIGDEPTAELLPRAEATRRYQEIVRKMVDPGLLEFVGNAMIQSSVFPVEPGAERTVTIAYEQVLDAHRGTVEYVLPRSSATSNTGVAWELNIEVESDKGDLGTVFSPSHPIVSTPHGGKRMSVEVPMLDEPGAFVLYAATGATGDEPTVLKYPTDDTSGYFMFVADAPEPEDTESSPMLRDVTIVIDRSGSMRGEKLEQAKEAAKQVVYGMRMGERISIVDYSSDVRSYADSSVVITKDSRKQVVEYIDRIRSGGGTNLHDALLEALIQPSADGMLPLVLFMTDGLATEGKTGEVQIREAAAKNNASNRRVFTFGVGLDVNAPLLDAIAQQTSAEPTYVLPGEDVEMKVGRVFDQLNGPVLIDTEFFGGIAGFCGTGMTKEMMDQINQSRVHSVEDGGLGDLYTGSRVVILGKYENPSKMAMWMRLTGTRNEETVVLGTHVSSQEALARYGFIPRLWAQQRIDSLVDQIRISTADGSKPNEELVEEITRLSLEHGVMTEYTAFLASEDMSINELVRENEFGESDMTTHAWSQMESQTANRSGSAGVSQSLNRQDSRVSELALRVASDSTVQSSGMQKSNAYYDADMNRVEITSVQRGHGSTLYRKNGRWVDGSVSENIEQAIDETVEFATDEYWSLVEDLTNQGRQWIVANRGEVELMNHGKRILVQNPN